MRPILTWVLAASLMKMTPVFANPPAAARQQAQARAELLRFGCTSVVDIYRNADGSWSGQCTKGGSIVPVAIGKDGAVSSPASQRW